MNDITNESPSGSRTLRPRSKRIAYEFQTGEEEIQVNKKKIQTGKKKTQEGKKKTQAAFVEQMQSPGAVPSRMKLLTGITVTPCTAGGTAPLLRTPLNTGAGGVEGAGQGGGVGRGGRGARVKMERMPVNPPQVANQSQVDTIDPNFIKNENDLENNEVEITFESHPRSQETIEAAEVLNKLDVMKQKTSSSRRKSCSFRRKGRL